MDSPRWLTVRDAAIRAGVSTATLQRWIRDGRLGALELGGARTVYRIHTDDLDQLIRLRNPEDASTTPVQDPAYDAGELLDALATLGIFPEVQGDLSDDDQVPAAMFREAAGHAALEMDVHASTVDVLATPVDEPPATTSSSERDALERELWMLPFSDLSVPAQMGEVCRLAARWLNADLVIVDVELTGWRFVSGDEPEGIAETVQELARQVMTGSEPVVSLPAPDDRFGQMMSVRIAGALRPAGAITACWGQDVSPGELYTRNLHFAASVASHILRGRPDQWLDMSDVARRCNVTEATVRRWIRQDQMAAIILGGDRAEYRVHTSDLEWFLYQHSRKRGAKHQRSSRS